MMKYTIIKILLSLFFVVLLKFETVAQIKGEGAGLRQSPVSYYMSFDNRDFFDEDFIERSGKKSIEERKIDFPEGKYGKGVRMSFIPAPPDATNMSGIDMEGYGDV